MSALHTQKANRTAWNDIGKGKTLDDLTVEDFDRVTAQRRREYEAAKNPATNPLVTALQEMRFGRLGRQIARAAWWQPKHPQKPSAATQEHTK